MSTTIMFWSMALDESHRMRSRYHALLDADRLLDLLLLGGY